MRRAALAGVAAAGAALGASELSARAVDGASLVLSVGEEIIERVPAPVEDAAISMFGTYDKIALVIGIVLVSVALGAGLGVVARRRFWVAAAGFGLFGTMGVLAGASRPGAAPAFTVLVGVASVAAGLVVLDRLLAPPSAGIPAIASAPTLEPRAPSPLSRRHFLSVLAGTAGAGVVARAGAGLISDGDQSTGPGHVRLPAARRALPAPPAGSSFPIEGLSPLVTANADFFRIDTALSTPRVDADSWRLRVVGMVERPLQLSYRQLLDMPLVEADIAISCVSNRVGGNLVGNARWLGVPLRHLLDAAGVRAGATQVVGRSVDGWTAGFPTSVALDGREAMVAVGMNGEPLPRSHGFPARLVVPGLYGYVSATKWLSEIVLTTLEAFDAYWVPRGWAKQAPVKTASRIDVPRDGQTLSSGRRTIAGVAWAPPEGISKVEVAVDDGPWVEATLAAELDADSWRLWKHDWDARRGSHTIAVRATDGSGAIQSERRSPPRPDGATGHHTIVVKVR